MKNTVALSFILISTLVFSQDYKTAIGIKGGYPGFGSLNAKHFISEKSLLESNDAVIYDSLLSWRHKPGIISENGLNTDKNGFRISRKESWIYQIALFLQ